MYAVATKRVCPDCRRAFAPIAIDSELCPVCESLSWLSATPDPQPLGQSGFDDVANKDGHFAP